MYHSKQKNFLVLPVLVVLLQVSWFRSTQSCITTPIDVLYVVDTSGSITDRNEKAYDQIVRPFLIDVTTKAAGINSENTYGAIIFSDIVQTAFTYQSYSAAVRQLQTLDYIGLTTDLKKALGRVEEVLNSRSNNPSYPDYIVIITDGVQNPPDNEVLIKASSLKARGATIIAIGVTGNIDSQTLQAIASSPSEYIRVQSLEDLSAAAVSFGNIVCPIADPVGPTGPEGPTGPIGPIGPPGDRGQHGPPGVGIVGPVGPTGPTGRPGVGIPGEPGTAGPIGPVGLTGPAGRTGPQGLTGNVGPRGETGTRGLQGSVGSQGPPGLTGSPGSKGAIGSIGSAGRTGPVGPIGPLGPNGLKGQLGSPGPTGPTGARGNNGIPGANGADGSVGSTGFPGPSGSVGSTGPSGPPGPAGDTGAPGRSGPQGSRGQVGLSGSTGPKGDNGPIGPGGPPGPTGPRGETGTRGTSGPVGPRGPLGPVGPIGPLGAVGPQGSKGSDGDTGSRGLAGPVGARGPAGGVGPQGPKGENGPLGPFGPIGPRGPSGFTGPIGPIGPLGPVGPTGPNGLTGLTGQAGQKGGRGDTGFTGPSGQNGLKGETGSRGPVGLSGSRGPSGPTGNPGRTGPTGPIGLRGQIGPGGPIGPIGPTGFKGDRGETGSRGFTGQTGPLGPQGVAGPQGARGPIGLNGETGSRGQTGQVGPRGPLGGTGATGPIGPNGLTGPRGVPGSQGVPGPVGSKGSRGSVGFTGPTGPVGPQGSRGDAGPSGSTGEKGEHGVSGPTGPQGNDGSTGSQGPPGLNGLPGIVGPRGPSGLPGSDGLAGSPGPRGDQGFSGPVGERGQSGQQGLSGRDGQPGPAGPPGPPGASSATCPTRNECLERNGNCQQACYDRYDSYYCGCNDGYKLTSIPYTCPGEKTTPDPCTAAFMDLVFVIDASGSIKDDDEKNWNLILSFVTRIIDTITIGPNANRVGIVYYSEIAANYLYLNNGLTKEQLKESINKLPFLGYKTNIAAALRTLKTNQFSEINGDRPTVTNIAIIIGDGEPNLEVKETMNEADAVKEAGITLFSVGITSNVSIETIMGLSSEPKLENRNWFYSKSFELLDEVSLALREETCTASLSSALCLQQKADILFIVESTANSADFSNYYLKYMEEILQPLIIGANDIRVAVTKVSNTASNVISFNSYSDKNDLIKQIKAITTDGGDEANHYLGFFEAVNTQFKLDKGDRADAANVIITLAEKNPSDSPKLTNLLREIKDGQKYGSFLVNAIGFLNGGIDKSNVQQISSSGQEDIDFFVSSSYEGYSSSGISQRILAQTCASEDLTLSNLHCMETSEAGKQCFCKYSDCDVRSINSTQCANMNECTETNNQAGCSHGCTDTEGSYYCYCFSGYVSYDSHTCADDDECKSSTACSNGFTCVNSPGSHYCVQNSVLNGAEALVLEDGNRFNKARLTGAPAAIATTGFSSTNVILTIGVSVLGGAMIVLLIVLSIRQAKRNPADEEATNETNVYDDIPIDIVDLKKFSATNPNINFGFAN